MKRQFDYFVVFAEMRTGSNYLESNLNSYPGLACHGEAFNPHFIGYPNKSELLGVTYQQREHDPQRLLNEVKSQDELSGFRFFHDHDRRVVDEILDDERCAKIILTRNILESYVSWKIAVATGQWKLTNVTRRKDQKIKFDGEEFAEFANRQQKFRARINKTLQRTAQTAFYIDYSDLRDIEVINGLATHLGESHQIKSLNKNFKKQNPNTLASKVSNPDEMASALADLDLLGAEYVPEFEPARAAGVGSYLACQGAPFLFAPVPCGPTERVKSWLETISGEEVATGFTQKDLRRWKRNTQDHRSFTVVRHPAARAHSAFCKHVLNRGPNCFGQIRKTLIRVHDVALPDNPQDSSYDRVAHREAFLKFLKFLKANLSGQTAIRVDGVWASQTAIIQGMASFAMPDLVLREATLERDLEYLAFHMGKESPELPRAELETPFCLDDIYDEAIEQAVRAAYQRDYMTFGFGAWQEI